MYRIVFLIVTCVSQINCVGHVISRTSILCAAHITMCPCPNCGATWCGCALSACISILTLLFPAGISVMVLVGLNNLSCLVFQVSKILFAKSGDRHNHGKNGCFASIIRTKMWYVKITWHLCVVWGTLNKAHSSHAVWSVAWSSCSDIVNSGEHVFAFCVQVVGMCGLFNKEHPERAKPMNWLLTGMVIGCW